MQFRTTVLAARQTATGLPVPDDVVTALGGGRRPAVTVRLNGYSYRSTVAVMGGQDLVPLAAEYRAAAGVEAGQEVVVDLELDTEPRTVEPPAALAAVMDDADRAAFAALSPSKQKAHALAVDGAKTDATRDRRVEAVLVALRG
ncbi:DUF1905 domain-containing protein [Geodermatophilaceae bacterium NBWT11]|nr:DUF1905 domain-containing protein [Geodermatophilaceae bacterium NBWT11]